MTDVPMRLEALSRLEQMATDKGDTWDLSRNDQAAIRRVLDDLAAAEQRVMELAESRSEMMAQRNAAYDRALEAERRLQELSIMVLDLIDKCGDARTLVGTQAEAEQDIGPWTRTYDDMSDAMSRARARALSSPATGSERP